LHGGTWLAQKADGEVAARAAADRESRRPDRRRTFALAGLWVAVGIEGYAITSAIDHKRVLEPAGQDRGGAMPARGSGTTASTRSCRGAGAWRRGAPPRRGCWRHGAPASGPSLPALSASPASSATAGISLFPFLLPSSTQPAASLTVWDASSSRLTLFIMLIAVVLLLPIVLAYTAFALRVDARPGTARGRRAPREPLIGSARHWYFSWIPVSASPAPSRSWNAMWLELTEDGHDPEV